MKIRKKLMPFILVLAFVPALSPIMVFAKDYGDSIYHIPWRFSVYEYPDKAARRIATFAPQYIRITYTNEYGWAKIPTVHGEYWVYLNLAPPLWGRTVILDAGHGLGADITFMNYSEQATMLRLALKAKPLLEELGATVLLTRGAPENVPLHTRPALINKWTLQALRAASDCEEEIAEIDRLIHIMEKIIANPEYYASIYMSAPFDWTRRRAIHPDLRRIFYLQNNPIIYQNFLAISLHTNATSRPVNTGVNGADVYIISNTTHYSINYFNNYTNFERSRTFADLLLDKIDALGISRRQISTHNAFVLIREHNIPAALVENGFHTNPSDRAKLMCNIFLQSLAAAYARAIVDYFNQIRY
ncbi:MAG: N-acetylmuramoyl-L-alanine amidase [Clostridiales bacterium]|nr:N-acetylmuramoyl-L-alanine amidase [Clostridiales bacterium]